MSSSSRGFHSNAVNKPIQPWFLIAERPQTSSNTLNPTFNLVAEPALSLNFSVAWYTLPYPAGALYREFALRNPRKDLKTTAANYGFWSSLKNSSTIIPIVTRLSAARDMGFNRRIYVETTHPGPWGQLIWKLINCPQAANALIIHAFGVRNKSPCRQCLQNYVSSGGGRPDQAGAMTPFFECVSLPGEFDNKCSNCMYGEDPKCSFATFEEEWQAHSSCSDNKSNRRLSGGGLPSTIGSNISRTDGEYLSLKDAYKLASDQAKLFKSSADLSTLKASPWSGIPDGLWNKTEVEELPN